MTISIADLKQKDACQPGIDAFRLVKKHTKVKNPTVDDYLKTALRLGDDCGYGYIAWGLTHYGDQLSKEVIKQVDWNRFRQINIVDILITQPKFIKYMPERVLGLDSDYWVSLLSHNPKLFKYCVGTHIFNDYDVANLVSTQPSTMKHFNTKEFTTDMWVDMIISRPQLLKKCDVINKFTKEDWIDMIYNSSSQSIVNACPVKWTKDEIQHLKDGNPRLRFKKV